MVSKVEHGNGVRWSQTADPTGMARPYRIRTTGASDDLNTGIFKYDGAGNIVRTGADRYLYDQVSRVTTAELDKYPVSCPQSQTVSGSDNSAASYDSCGTMDVGPYAIGSSGKVTLRAEGTIAFHDGFSVASGGSLAAESGAVLDLSPAGPTQRTQGYDYDRFGNLTATTTDGSTETVDIDESTNRMSSVFFQYDLSGNVTTQPTGAVTWAYDYDPFNMLRHVTRPDGTGYVFVYGPGDERTWAVNWTGNSEPQTWRETFTLRDLDGSPLRRYRYAPDDNQPKHWSLDRDYVWRGNTLLAAIRDPGTNEQTVYLHPDHLGSPRILTDAAGNTIETHLYFPFGQEAYSSTADDEVLHFTGHEWDNLDPGGDTVDLDYMHARYFSAHLGRFTSVDRVGGSQNNPQSWNRYAYVLGNPVNLVDPRGEFAEGVGQLIGQAISDWLKCLESGECPSDRVNVKDKFDPLTGVSGYVDLIAGSAFTLGLSGAPGGTREGNHPSGLGTSNQAPFELSFFESALAALPFDGGVEYGQCVRRHRFEDWGVIAGSAVPKRLVPPFRVPRPDQPLTTPARVTGFLLKRALPESATAERIALGLKFGGRAVSHVATPLTIGEGFYDIGVLTYCGFAN